jgi:hypothetical protein
MPLKLRPSGLGSGIEAGRQVYLALFLDAQLRAMP